MWTPLPFIPGEPGEKPGPLARYLPPLPGGLPAAWLHARAAPGSWVLDPFGAAPALALEAARAGYRLLVAANNPILRFLLETHAAPPQPGALRAALAALAAARKGDERLEPHILSLYATPCAQCGQEVAAEAFLWERKAAAPYARIYRCPHCGDSGERPASPADGAAAARFAHTSLLHRARAIERVAPLHDPDRPHAEEALEAYLPRALYALLTLINKLAGLPLTPAQRHWLTALLLTACDQANTLWPHPVARARPRQLTIPPQHRENNLWLALEAALEIWAMPGHDPIPLTQWPDLPPETGGICLFEGRLKALQLPPGVEIQAIVTALPRPNQAFWTLSALWAGWLWGREAMGPFKSVLRRRRYDWGWHTSALHAALEHLPPLLPRPVPMLGLVAEAEPGFLSAAFLGARLAGLPLTGIALRLNPPLAQLEWQVGGPPSPPGSPWQTAPQNLLHARGEPTPYLHLHTAALAALVTGPGLSLPPEGSPAQLYSEVDEQLKQAFTYLGGYLRFGGSQSSLEAGLWWLREPAEPALPLADRVEAAVLAFLETQPNCTFAALEAHLCTALPSLLTPERELIFACLESYGQATAPESGLWSLRPEDQPAARRADLAEMAAVLAQTGARLGYLAQTGAREAGQPLVWEEPDGAAAAVFYTQPSAALGARVFGEAIPARRRFIVLPGSRANLVAYKQQRDPRLALALEGKWEFVKFRLVRRLAILDPLPRSSLDEQIALDPLTSTAPQMKML